MPDMLGTEVSERIIEMYKNAKIALPKLYCCTSEDILQEESKLKQAVIAAGMLGTLNKPLSFR